MGARAFQPDTPRHLIYLSLFPVLICEVALFPFWSAGGHTAPWVRDAQLFITVCLLPVYLATVTSVFVWRAPLRGIVFGFATLFPSIALAVFLAYAAWGIASRRFWAPDYETVFILRQAGLLALAVGLLPPLATLACRFISLYARRNA
jgi:hypothetical protein